MGSLFDDCLSRRGFLKQAALSGLIAGGGGLSYAHWLEPTLLTVTEQDLSVPRLPRALDGLRVAQLTDLHFRPGDDDALIDRMVAETNAAAADLAVLTGDYLTEDPRVIPPLLERLAPLQAKHGVYAVLGNHDGWHAEASFFRRNFRRHGIELLVNQGTTLSIGGANLFVAGTDHVWLGKPDIVKALRGRRPDDPCLALVHEPDYFDVVRQDHDGLLQLSGHTHGGQCRVPLFGFAPVKVTYGHKYVYGAFAKEDAALFVSRGLGTSGLRVRFACSPEVAVLTLRSPVETRSV